MADSFGKLQLKGRADEDIYFAKRDRELIEALRKKKLRDSLEDFSKTKRKQAKKYEKRFAEITDKHRGKPKKLRKALSKLVAKTRKRISGILNKA